MEKKKENKKQVEFDRDDLTETNNFLKKCKKEIAFCTIKPVKTSKKDEMENLILFRNKKICQICFSKVAFFTQYRFEKKGRSIFKPTNQDEIDQAYGWVINRVQKLEDDFEERKVTKKQKPEETKNTESVQDLEKRVENLSPKSNAIHIKNVNDEILSWAESSNYKFVDDHTLKVRIA